MTRHEDINDTPERADISQEISGPIDATKYSAIPQQMPKTITSEIRVRVGTKCADILAEINVLQSSNDPKKHQEIAAKQHEFEENLNPEVQNEILDELIPALVRTPESDAPRKAAQRGVFYKFLEGLHHPEAGQVKIKTLKPVDGLREDIREKADFILEEIRIREFEHKVRSLYLDGDSWEQLNQLKQEAIQRGWVFINNNQELESTIAFCNPTETEHQPPEFLQSDDEDRARLFKKVYKKATKFLIASFNKKEADLKEAAIKHEIKKQGRRRESQVQEHHGQHSA